MPVNDGLGATEDELVGRVAAEVAVWKHVCCVAAALHLFVNCEIIPWQLLNRNGLSSSSSYTSIGQLIGDATEMWNKDMLIIFMYFNWKKSLSIEGYMAQNQDRLSTCNNTRVKKIILQYLKPCHQSLHAEITINSKISSFLLYTYAY
jgi:hypothetical protein